MTDAAGTPPRLDHWAHGAHSAIRAMVESIGGNVAAFDRDPLTFQAPLDDFVARLPWRDFEQEDWIWLHSQLVAYAAEILIRTRGGRWMRVTDASASTGHRYLISLTGRDGSTRQVDLHTLVLDHLHPVPQRIPLLIERALDAGGFGPKP